MDNLNPEAKSNQHRLMIAILLIFIVGLGTDFYESYQSTRPMREAPRAAQEQVTENERPTELAPITPLGNHATSADFEKLIQLIQAETNTTENQSDQEYSDLSLTIGTGIQIHEQSPAERFWNTVRGYIQRGGKAPGTFP